MRDLRPTMKLRWLFPVLGFAACHGGATSRARQTIAHPASDAPVITGPTVVAFWLSASDTLQGGRGVDLLEDFRLHTARVAPDLDESGIALVATTADSIIVVLEGGPRRIIPLRGLDLPFGYVLIEPGYAETILTGVTTEDDLLEQVTWYFGLDEDEPGADSAAASVTSFTVSARPPRGP
jgi:hypothetical protein